MVTKQAKQASRLNKRKYNVYNTCIAVPVTEGNGTTVCGIPSSIAWKQQITAGTYSWYVRPKTRDALRPFAPGDALNGQSRGASTSRSGSGKQASVLRVPRATSLEGGVVGRGAERGHIELDGGFRGRGKSTLDCVRHNTRGKPTASVPFVQALETFCHCQHSEKSRLH